MGLDHLNFRLYWKNLTSPRGTASQFDVLKEHPQLPLVLTNFASDVVIVTMAARILQTMISLSKNLLQKRTLYWMMLPRGFLSKALRTVVVVCWSVLDVLLPLLMSVYVYKRVAVSKSEKPMNMVTKGHCEGPMEPEKMMDGEICSLTMETVGDIAKMEVDSECEQMLKEQVLLPSCTNPIIMSMICMPTDETDSSDESEVDSVKGLDFSQEEMSTDSGLQESWTPGSKCEEDLGEGSDWSDEDSWDEDSNSCQEDNDDLWASFCRSDDPYNPLSFAMPMKGPKRPDKEVSIESGRKQQILGHLDCSEVRDVKMECGTVTEKPKLKTKLCKKPMLSGYKSTHKCTLPKEEAKEEADQSTKKVRFSSKVTVHPIITWSFAHRMARKGPWEVYARDRSRFQRRIAETEAAIGFCLKPHHRENIWAGLYANPS
ncbi:protein phosphatase 1 regulatory subunit 15A-like [Ranitomeya imitator]|uniref:protein phosphatase 1 regulatory subunit 15A-like n=1 Tax=Ranitomeya imitator TaxID=111125 RepID=UPI0037E7F927